MPRKTRSAQFTPLELEIMKVLWDTGEAPVQVVQQRLMPERKLAYTTVQTMLNVLYRKGKLKRALKDRAYVYRPVLSRQKAIRATLQDLVDRLFGGSAESLVMSLVETDQLKPEELARIERLLKESEPKVGEAEPGGKEGGGGND